MASLVLICAGKDGGRERVVGAFQTPGEKFLLGNPELCGATHKANPTGFEKPESLHIPFGCCYAFLGAIIVF